MGIAEIELREIAVQMALRTMLINATHTALEDREEAFNGVGANRAARILFLAVSNAVVLGEVIPKVPIVAGLIGVDGALLADIRQHDRHGLLHGGAGDVEAAGLASVAIDETQHDVLVGIAVALGNVRELTVVGFVNLDSLSIAFRSRPVRSSAATASRSARLAGCAGPLTHLSVAGAESSDFFQSVSERSLHRLLG